MMSMKSLSVAVVVVSLIAGLAVPALAAQNVRLRGTLETVADTKLTVKTREGEVATVTLNDGWQVSSVAKASVDDIKAGDFVGVASVPNANGADGALEVVIFPASLKGAGEGSRPWDLQPDSTMTNATVAEVVAAADGHTLTVTYDGGTTKTISIPAGIPIVTFVSATPADLIAGATVFVPAKKSDDGTFASSHVVVSTKGVVPPM